MPIARRACSSTSCAVVGSRAPADVLPKRECTSECTICARDRGQTYGTERARNISTRDRAHTKCRHLSGAYGRLRASPQRLEEGPRGEVAAPARDDVITYAHHVHTRLRYMFTHRHENIPVIFVAIRIGVKVSNQNRHCGFEDHTSRIRCCTHISQFALPNQRVQHQNTIERQSHRNLSLALTCDNVPNRTLA
jgi:hypothetical protein